MLRGVMGRDPVKGSTALGFNRDLDEARAAGARAVVVHVGSDGGDLAEADAMALHLQALAHLGVASVASVTNASSAASVVALACSYSVTTPGGRWFLHNPHLGDAPATPENLAGLDAPRERLHAFYRARTVLGASELVGVLGTEWGTFDASAALAKGLTDEVGDELRAVQVARDAAAGKGLPESPRRLALASRLQGAA
jgi:ATP-dependent protease ClpP protease subunit